MRQSTNRTQYNVHSVKAFINWDKTWIRSFPSEQQCNVKTAERWISESDEPQRLYGLETTVAHGFHIYYDEEPQRL